MAELSWASAPGAPYYIYVNGWEGQVGDFSLMVREGDIPGNSDCANSIFVESGDELEGTTEFSKVPDVEPCDSG